MSTSPVYWTSGAPILWASGAPVLWEPDRIVPRDPVAGKPIRQYRSTVAHALRGAAPTRALVVEPPIATVRADSPTSQWEAGEPYES